MYLGTDSSDETLAIGYSRVLRPMIVYGSFTAVKSLSKIQRAAGLGVLGAMKGTSTVAMEVLLCLPPLDI